MALVAKQLANSQTNNNYLEKDQNLKYLAYEDFTHIGEGYETYHDGVQHPLELRKILTGQLSKEMSVTFKLSDEDSYRDLVHPFSIQESISDDLDTADIVNDTESGLEITESKSLAQTNNLLYQQILPKPPKLIKAGISKPPVNVSIVPANITSTLSSSLLSTSLLPTSLPPSSLLPTSLPPSPPPVPFLGGLWDTSDSGSILPTNEDINQDFEDASSVVPSRRGGRPPAQQGTYDPETGTYRFICRLNCGASLASAKGRRKHEKKHCPNMAKNEQAKVEEDTLLLGNSMMEGHSLFHGRSVTLKSKESFECRICGKVLKTYEGRRLHEKLQHKPNKVKKENGIETGKEEEGIENDRGKKEDGESLESVKIDDGEVETSMIEDDYEEENDDFDDKDEQMDDAQEINDHQ